MVLLIEAHFTNEHPIRQERNEKRRERALKRRRRSKKKIERRCLGMFACVWGTHTLWRVLGSHVRSLSAHLLHFSEQAAHGEGRAGAIGSSKTERETERKTAEGEGHS